MSENILCSNERFLTTLYKYYENNEMRCWLQHGSYTKVPILDPAMELR